MTDDRFISAPGGKPVVIKFSSSLWLGSFTAAARPKPPLAVRKVRWSIREQSDLAAAFSAVGRLRAGSVGRRARKEGRKRVPAGERKRVPARPVPPEVTVPTRESPGRAGRSPRALPRPLAAVSLLPAGGDGRASEPPPSALRAGLGTRFPCQLRAASSHSANSELPDYKKKVWMLLMVDLMIVPNYFFNLNARLKIGCAVDVIEFS